ncbi:unnamed protein product, partial [Pylaiella littoralis]
PFVPPGGTAGLSRGAEGVKRNGEQQEGTSAATAEVPPAAAAAAVATPVHSRGRKGGIPRRLQDESCGLAADFSLPDTDYVTAPGCYSVFSMTDPYMFVAETTKGVIFRSTVVTQDYADTWMSAEVLSITGYAWELSLECQSNEPWELGSHPSDVAEWTYASLSAQGLWPY